MGGIALKGLIMMEIMSLEIVYGQHQSNRLIIENQNQKNHPLYLLLNPLDIPYNTLYSCYMPQEVEIIKKAVPELTEDDEAVRKYIREKEGLTYEALCRSVSEGLNAETVLINKDTRKEVGRVPNHTVRAKFAPLAAEIIGAKKAEGGAQKAPTIHIHLPDGTTLR
jgi:hypothetical protein